MRLNVPAEPALAGQRCPGLFDRLTACRLMRVPGWLAAPSKSAPGGTPDFTQVMSVSIGWGVTEYLCVDMTFPEVLLCE